MEGSTPQRNGAKTTKGREMSHPTREKREGGTSEGKGLKGQPFSFKRPADSGLEGGEKRSKRGGRTKGPQTVARPVRPDPSPKESQRTTTWRPSRGHQSKERWLRVKLVYRPALGRWVGGSKRRIKTGGGGGGQRNPGQGGESKRRRVHL